MSVVQNLSLSMCAAAAASVFFCASSAHAALIDHMLDMSVDPQAEGWILEHGPDMPGAHGVSSGVLWIDSPQFRRFRAFDAIWNDVVSNAQGWSIEARTRLETDVVRSDSRIQLWMMDDVNFNRLEIYADHITLLSGFIMQTYAMDTTSSFHTYTIEAQGTNTRVLVDGVEQLSVDWVTAQGATFVMNFGDGAGSFPSYSYWDSVRITHLPTPGAAALFVLAGGLATRRRGR